LSSDPDEVVGLTFSWSFAVLYMAAGTPVYGIPLGTQVVGTLQGANTAVACFEPDRTGDYILAVTVTDSSGASLTDRVTIHVEDCHKTYPCSYESGWNLLSLSAQPIDFSAGSILSGTGADAGPFGYRAGGYYLTQSMSPTTGYWVHFVTPETVWVLGREIRNDVDIELEYAGWHLISSPFPIDWDGVAVLIGGTVRLIGEEPTRQAIDDFCACYDTEADVYRIATEMTPCLGYWVRTREEHVTLRLRWQSRSPGASSAGCSGTFTTMAPRPPGQLMTPPGPNVLATPNPVRSGAVHFQLLTPEASAIRVRIHDASGHLVWDAQGDGTALDWDLQDRDGRGLASGPYIYCILRQLGTSWLEAGCSILFLATSG
jgi:hypothetical protein